MSRDRLQLLLAPGAQLNGIDFVDVSASQTELSIHFLNAVALAGTLSGSPAAVISGGEVVATVAVRPVDDSPGSPDWSADQQGRPVLRLRVAAPGDFSTYTLAIGSGKLDPFFATVPFTFKAGLPEHPRLRRAQPRLPGARATGCADRLPGQGLRQLHPRAVGVLRAALPGLGRAVRGRPRRGADGGARRTRR